MQIANLRLHEIELAQDLEEVGRPFRLTIHISGGAGGIVASPVDNATHSVDEAVAIRHTLPSMNA